MQSRIRAVLESREAMALPELVQAVNADRETVARELREGVHARWIERLAPVPDRSRAGTEPARTSCPLRLLPLAAARR